MATLRATPFDLVFGAALAAERFPALLEAVRRAGRDPEDRDGFVLVPEVVTFLQELRPDAGIGAAMDEFVAFVHAAVLFWRDGERVIAIGSDTVTRLLGSGSRQPAGSALTSSRSYYVQVAPQRIWGAPIEGQPPEPLDGGFIQVRAGRLTIVAVFGIFPGREGFTIVDGAGPANRTVVRADQSAPFSSQLEGGVAAGLHSVDSEEELVELGWRVQSLVGPDGPAPGRSEVVLA